MARTLEELRRSNIMSPEYKAAIEADPLLDLGEDPITHRARRAQLLADRRHLHATPGPIPEVSERDAKILMRDGKEITIRIYTPEATCVPNNGSPLYVAYHEGGFTAGDLTDEELNCRAFSKEFGFVCVNVDYRLAPEHKFPTYIHDCWDTLKWITKHAKDLGANPKSGFIVGGASAGGNISAVLATLARDEALQPPLTGVYLCVPAILNPSHVPEKYQTEYISWTENTEDPVLKNPGGRRGRERFEGISSVTGIDMSSPLFDPTYNSNGLRDYPPTFFEVAGMDPLRDEALIFERMLREENHISTRLVLHEGFGHMFWMNFPQMEASKQAARARLDGIRWLLEQKR